MLGLSTTRRDPYNGYTMSRTVHCAKLGKDAEGLDYAPLRDELGERIYREISKEAWDLWVKHQTMVINEYRLNPSEPSGQAVLRKQMEDFLFGEGSQLPPEYVPPKAE